MKTKRTNYKRESRIGKKMKKYMEEGIIYAMSLDSSSEDYDEWMEWLNDWKTDYWVKILNIKL